MKVKVEHVRCPNGCTRRNGAAAVLPGETVNGPRAVMAPFEIDVDDLRHPRHCSLCGAQIQYELAP